MHFLPLGSAIVFNGLALKLTFVSSISAWLDDMAHKPKAAGADLVWTPQRAI
jgi:hypothetical protein